MHPLVYQHFESVLAHAPIGGRVLEIGAAPTSDCLLFSPVLGHSSLRIGINKGFSSATTPAGKPIAHGRVHFLAADGNDLSFLRDGLFDIVLCNAVLEHDPFFWKTISEMRRVLRGGGWMVIGVPGYIGSIRHPQHPLATFTHRLHNWPGDYYRFSEQACREVFFAGFDAVSQAVLLVDQTPKIITYGFKPG